MKISSYPKVLSVGHPRAEGVFDSEVLIEEKIDGSQISFAKTNGQVFVRSKSVQINVENPDDLFCEAIEAIKGLPLREGFVYRGEYLQNTKHNTLQYLRIPKNHIIIFDIDTGCENYVTYDEKVRLAGEVGLEVVPKMFYGKVSSSEEFLGFMERESCLGGVKVEGLVIKNYNIFGADAKPVMVKHVSEDFKETNRAVWAEKRKGENPVEYLIGVFKNENRWRKAVNALRDAGTLENSPSDIGKLLEAVKKDIEKECVEEIKNHLYMSFRKKLLAGCVAGMPEWYKEVLLKSAFKEEGFECEGGGES